MTQEDYKLAVMDMVAGLLANPNNTMKNPRETVNLAIKHLEEIIKQMQELMPMLQGQIITGSEPEKDQTEDEDK